MRSATERRMAILQHLCCKRFDTRPNLMFEFGISKNTLDRDLQILACSYPIYTVPGKGGGVHILEGYSLSKKYLSKKQKEVLEKVIGKVDETDAIVLKEILQNFSKRA